MWLDVINFRKISAPDSSFYMEGELTLTWRDDSLTVPDENNTQIYEDNDIYPREGEECFGQYHLESKDKCKPFLPTPEFPGMVTKNYVRSQHVVNVGTPGWTGQPANPSATWVTGGVEFAGTFSLSQDLHDFPYDTQKVKLIVSTKEESRDFTFAIAGYVGPTSDPDGFVIKDSYSQAIPVRNDRLDISAYQATFYIVVKRIPTFFINRFVVPLCLIVFIAMCNILFMPNFAGRIASPMVAFSATVSFLFVSGQSVPQLPYRTRLDMFFNLCFLLSFLLFLYHCVNYLMFERLKKAIDEARKNNNGQLALIFPSHTPPPPPVDKKQDVEKGNVKPEGAAGAAAAPAAEPKPSAPKPMTLAGVAWQNSPERIDVVAFVVFVLSFVTGVCVILKGDRDALHV